MEDVTDHRTFKYKFNDMCCLFKHNKATMISALLRKKIFSLNFGKMISDFPQWFIVKNKTEVG